MKIFPNKVSFSQRTSAYLDLNTEVKLKGSLISSGRVIQPSLSPPFVKRLLELTREYVERAFDNGNFVLLSVSANDNPRLLWRIQITKYAAFNTDMGQDKKKDYDGKEFSFKKKDRPASRSA